MNIEIKTTAEKTTIRINTHLIPGEGDFKEFESIANKILEIKSKNVDIDLFKCNYLDTRAIAVLLEMHQALKKNGKILKLVNVNDDIAELLKSISLDKIIQLN